MIPPETEWLAKVAEVDSGKITPHEAEQWAEENGVKTVREALEREGTAQFDSANWPFFLAAAWVAFRERELTLKAWAEHRLWRQHLSSANLLADSVQPLIARLRTGKLVAIGIKGGQQERAEIPAVAWHDLTPERWGSADVFTFQHNKKPNYVDVLLHAATVRASWTVKNKAEKKVESSSAAEKQCKAKLIEIMLKSPTTPISKAKLRQRFQIPHRGFDRAFSEAAEESGCPAWSASGRRKSAQT